MPGVENADNCTLFPFLTEMKCHEGKSEPLPTPQSLRAPISVYKTLSVFFSVDSVSKQGPLVGDYRDMLRPATSYSTF